MHDVVHNKRTVDIIWTRSSIHGSLHRFGMEGCGFQGKFLRVEMIYREKDIVVLL